MRIGELATAAGVSVRVLRHYEAQELIQSGRAVPMVIENIRKASSKQSDRFVCCLIAVSAPVRSMVSCRASVKERISILRLVPGGSHSSLPSATS
jgi:hypothetical protein